MNTNDTRTTPPTENIADNGTLQPQQLNLELQRQLREGLQERLRQHSLLQLFQPEFLQQLHQLEQEEQQVKQQYQQQQQQQQHD